MTTQEQAKTPDTERVMKRLVQQLGELKEGKREAVWLDAWRARGPEEAETILRKAMKAAKVSVNQYPISIGVPPVKPKWSSKHVYVLAPEVRKALKEKKKAA